VACSNAPSAHDFPAPAPSHIHVHHSPTSFVMRLSSRPVGCESKKLMGRRTTQASRRSCSRRAARTPPTTSVTALATCNEWKGGVCIAGWDVQTGINHPLRASPTVPLPQQPVQQGWR